MINKIKNHVIITDLKIKNIVKIERYGKINCVIPSREFNQSVGE